MTHSEPTLPKNTQDLSLTYLAANHGYSIPEIEHAISRYGWCAFLFESIAEWAFYALTRTREALNPAPQGA
jgi:hypothetical protein